MILFDIINKKIIKIDKLTIKNKRDFNYEKIRLLNESEFKKNKDNF